jgi:hypothetical protein
MRKCRRKRLETRLPGSRRNSAGIFYFSRLLAGRARTRPGIGDCHLRARSLSNGLNRAAGHLLAAALCVLFALLLSGCGTITAQTGTSAYIAPGKFDVYTCSDITERTQHVQKRKDELEQLMGRASDGGGGAIVNAIAYQAEYQQSRDELVELSKASADKQCASKSQWSSGRAVF